MKEKDFLRSFKGEAKKCEEKKSLDECKYIQCNIVELHTVYYMYMYLHA